MILVNLLPDLRQAKLREQRRRQLVSGIAVLIWAVCGGVVVLMALYAVGQSAFISNATHQIQNKEDDLKSMPDLIPALTAQQHLNSLSTLYGQRVYLSKFFEAYQEADPQSTTINALSVDESNVLTVTGQSPTYAEVAKVARALEASNVRVGVGAAAANAPYFTGVQITTVSSPRKGEVDFTLTASLSSGVVSLGN
jgi:Tfp pilus assembly protein PilN